MARSLKIIVTGGAGFIGSHLVDRYLIAGHRVVAIDNLITGQRGNINREAGFYQADVNDPEAVEKIFAAERPDVVNHHAAFTEVVRSTREPLAALQTNILSAVNLLLAGARHGLKKFIFSSTSAVYGNPKKIPVSEKGLKQPLSPYGLSKLLSEECVRFYSRSGAFTYIIFRYPNVYGPRQNPKGEAGVVAIFSDLLRDKKTPTIFGNGGKGRDYTYVDDIVRANMLALTKGENEIINLGWGTIVTDDEVFRTIARALKTDASCAYAPFRAGEVYRIALDARRARTVLGWRPHITFRQGVRRYLEFLG